ncbi:MAG TPA: hypothetical protein VK886_02840 [Vicinamibacterales bacterium]|nr:hypothetical protein [Vicinamibacterales bacterium]
MDQRRLKVGDIVDDYCPRERRITDHAVVAMIDDTIRQTRCTACDNEHPYKEARLPRVRRKAAAGALYQEVLAGAAESAAPPAPPKPAAAEAPEPLQADGGAGSETVNEPAQDNAPPADEGPVHRPLIRATLPRPEGSPPPAGRPLPEFTVRQATARGRFRDDFRTGFRPAGRNGNSAGHGRPGRPGGPSQQQRARHGRPAHHKKRSR